MEYQGQGLGKQRAGGGGGGGGGVGHTLGGSGSSSTSAHLSPQEMRIRRLAALQQPPPPVAEAEPGHANATPASGARQSLLSPSSETRSGPPSSSLNAAILANGDNSATITAAGASGGGGGAAVVSSSSLSSTANIASPTTTEAEAAVFTDVSKFHELMWDRTTTVDNDKLRWVSQAIALRTTHQEDIDGSWLSSSSSSSSSSSPSNNNEAAATATESNSSSTISKEESLLSWGLVQQHGGPCGVLAALQAELLRLLLFDDEDDDNNGRIRSSSINNNSSNNNPSLASSPIAVASTASTVAGGQNHNSGLSWTPLARTISLLLARAAVMPQAAATADTTTTTGSSSSQSMSSAAQQQTSSNNDNDDDVSPAAAAVRIILPRHRNALTWGDLQPWPGNNDTASSSSGDQLVVYTISLSNEKDDDAEIITTDIANNNGNVTTTKRQKITNSNVVSQKKQNLMNHYQHRVEVLARAVSHFLLLPFPAASTTTDTIDADDVDQRQLHSHRPLDCFFHPGGVMLLVMSLVASRGFGVVQSEFDDPVNSKLAAQFGHCSQELMNLLLTGQAVSNVFDNSMKLDGEITCRGVSYRPNVGYLSQLESLRYCAVGDYYKSPHYPIWVVGSTSHFTILFGERSALHESHSDQLLERCRRAFQTSEGASENGLIATAQLKRVYETLELQLTKNNNSNDNNSSEDELLQMLAASMEVGGANIILWDDFWKTTSRLMTGASIEAILQQGYERDQGFDKVADIVDDDLPALIPNEEPPAIVGPQQQLQQQVMFAGDDHLLQPAEATTQMETDEEMARRLTREFEEECRQGHQGQHFSGARAASPMEVDPANAGSAAAAINSSHSSTLIQSDEEFARKLQAELDAEAVAASSSPSGGGASSVAAVGGDRSDISPPPLMLLDHVYGAHPATPPPPSAVTATGNFMEEDEEEAKKPAALPSTSEASSLPTGATDATSSSATAQSATKQDFEQYGETFSLYHYNGLRGGVLTPFRVTRLTADEAVGASIALNRLAATGGGHRSGGSDMSLEDVVRTKWPSCMVNWLGQNPPYID